MYHGIVNIYKEKGFTSFDVVAKLRGVFKQRKIGHTGTLDPDAEGVLPVVLGDATKLVDILTDKTKEYICELKLGVETDTEDLSGNILKTSEVSVSKEELENALNSFIGGYMQVPPMYSAVWVNGKRLYDLARAGKEVERPKRAVSISAVELLEFKDDTAKIRIECGRGTYIRSLCRDIGEKLGCGGCMASLIRTKSGDYRIEEAVKISELEGLSSEALSGKVLTVESFFSDLKDLHVIPEMKKKADNGNPMVSSEFTEIPETSDGELFRTYSPEGAFFAIYRYNAGRKLFLPHIMFPNMGGLV